MRLRLALLSLFAALSLQAQPLGYLAQDLKAKEAYAGQSAYMDFYHGLALSQEGVDISLSGLLSIDGVVSSGAVYEDDIKRLYPFPNTLVVLKMSGEEILKYLEASYDGWIGTISSADEPLLLLRSLAKADGSSKWNFKNSPANFDSAAGIDYTVDVTCPAGSRVKISGMADGTPFLPEAVYRVALNNYRASGAGKLLQAAGIDPQNMEDRIVLKDKPFRTILRECLAACGTLEPSKMSRGSWRFVPEVLAAPAMEAGLELVFGAPGKPRYNTRKEILADIEKAGAVHYMYPEYIPSPTAAPKGYEPFYISHVGRHGARFALGSTVYSDLWKIWDKGKEKGWLTPEGERIYQAYNALYPAVKDREGQLTRKGQDQHRRIARQMYRDYPQVFKGATRADAVSTYVHRVIVSMYSCLAELEALDKDFSWQADYGYPYQNYLLPPIIDAPNSWPASVEKKYNKYRADRLDLSGMLGRWFTRPDSLITEPYKFCYDMHTVISTLDNLDTDYPEALLTVFTPEERYRLWEVFNYGGYLRLGLSPEVENVRPESMKALLRDIVDKADEDISSRSVQLRLRFAHDSSVLPLLSLMDVNGMGVRMTDPYELENYWRTFDIPMACNLQLVFFRSRRNADILVQVLLNGREATLPLPMAAPGSFYRWADVRAHYAALLP